MMRHKWSWNQAKHAAIGGSLVLVCWSSAKAHADELPPKLKLTVATNANEEKAVPNDVKETRNVSYVRSAKLQEVQSSSAGEPTSFTSDTAETPQSSQNTKEPISLPKLSTPNLSIQAIGTGKTPEDWVEGRLPAARMLPFGPDREYMLSPYVKSWMAPKFCHQPLYFEDVMLERHGHEKCTHLTPMLSGVRFYTNALTAPYLAWLRPPLRDISNVGHYRPGSGAPALRQRAPYDPAALRFQLLTTGVVFNLTP